MPEDSRPESMQTPRPRSHRDLIVWQKACQMVVTVYRITTRFPKQERYGITSQMRNCAASVPANIAEGAGRWGPVEFQRFLSIARGSLAELDTWVEVAYSLKLIEQDEAEALRRQIDELASMVIGLRQSLSSAREKQSK